MHGYSRIHIPVDGINLVATAGRVELRHRVVASRFARQPVVVVVVRGVVRAVPARDAGREREPYRRAVTEHLTRNAVGAAGVRSPQAATAKMTINRMRMGDEGIAADRGLS